MTQQRMASQEYTISLTNTVHMFMLNWLTSKLHSIDHNNVVHWQVYETSSMTLVHILTIVNTTGFGEYLHYTR